MGWRPWEVRRCTLADFFASFNGWKIANGAADQPSMSREEIMELRAELWGE